MHFTKSVLMASLLWTLFFIRPAAADVDHGIYAQLLARHVQGHRVDYDGFKKDEIQLDAYLDLLGQTDVTRLPENSRFAFYINAYNAFTIKLVLSGYPGINSIKELGTLFSSPWSKEFIVLKTGTLSLDDIEHQILRPEFKDPRVHFAINCASKSCPQLRNEPYDGSRLDEQLDDQASGFINNPKFTFVKQNTLYTSKIFKWFKEDFNDNPLMFIKHYAAKELKDQIIASNIAISIQYLEYDWSLNR